MGAEVSNSLEKIESIKNELDGLQNSFTKIQDSARKSLDKMSRNDSKKKL